MQKYETIFISKPDWEETSRHEFHEKLKDLVAKMGGQVHVSEEVGKIRLAYEVKKEMKGYYYYLGFEGNQSILLELEKNLRFNESVMKFQTCKVDNEFNATILPMEPPRSSVGGRYKPRTSGFDEGRRFDREDSDYSARKDFSSSSNDNASVPVAPELESKEAPADVTEEIVS